jgi:hypothetical protein
VGVAADGGQLPKEGQQRMKFSEAVAQTLAWSSREGRVSYRALKRDFEKEDFV